MKRIETALMQRKISSQLAKQLVGRGYTLGKLKQLSEDELLSLGMTSESISMIHNESRPPISEGTLRKLLYESNYVCCICKDRNAPIIIHHIIPWEESRSHNIDNLVVLCLLHHGEAHTKHDLSINLTAERIIDAKRRWLEAVKEKNIVNVQKINKTEYSFYDFFNVNRIFELVDSLNIDPDSCKYFHSALEYGFINNLGLIRPLNSWSEKKIDDKTYWIDFFEGTYLYHYLKELFTNIINKQHFIYINEIWNKSDISSIIAPGSFVLVQGLFSFKRQTRNSTGNRQIKSVYRKARGIKIEFEIDAFYCNSDSSRSHLSGRSVKTVYCIVRSISTIEENLIISCTALAIGTNFARLDDPDYPFPTVVYEDEFEEEFEDINNDDAI